MQREIIGMDDRGVLISREIKFLEGRSNGDILLLGEDVLNWGSVFCEGKTANGVFESSWRIIIVSMCLTLFASCD